MKNFKLSPQNFSLTRLFVITLAALTIALLLMPSGAARAATIAVACGDVAGLKTAITASAANDTITLAANCTYTLATSDNTVVNYGANGLPAINKALTISGGPNTVIAASGNWRIFYVAPGGNLTISGLTLRSGRAQGGLTATNRAGGGGAIMNRATLTVNTSILENNTAENGGGAIFNDFAPATVTVSNSILRGNAANGGGFAGGGAIFNENGTVTITGSTLSGNTAGGTAAWTGGGALIAFGGTIRVNNSTLSGNTTTPGAQPTGGGAIVTHLDVNVSIASSTIAGNTAPNSRGGAFARFGGGTFVMRNSIISGNTAPTDAEMHGAFTSNGYNIIGTAPAGFTAGAGDQLSTDAQLSALADNGGSTTTHSIPVTSPAVDAGDPAGCNAYGGGTLTTDQRGVARTDGNGDTVVRCDVGAYEYEVPVIPPPATGGGSGGGTTTTTSSGPTVDGNVGLCADLDGSTNAVVRVSTAGIAWGVNCRIIAMNGGYMRTAAEIGVQSVLDMGVLHAVDVFNPSSATFQPMSVCLQGAGSLIFLAAAQSPRQPQALSSGASGGYTCATISAPGTVVLVSAGVSAPAAQTASTTTQPTVQSIALTDCQVTTKDILNLRDEASASANIVTLVPFGTTLNAIERQGDWIKVIFGAGQGFLNVSFLDTAGTCG